VTAGALAVLLLVVTPGAAGGQGSPLPLATAPVASPLGPHRNEVPAAAPTFPTPIRHVFIVMFENYPRSTVMADGPFQSSLTDRFASADHFYGVCHPGGADYLVSTSGSTAGLCGHGGDAWWNYNVTNLADASDAAGLTWADYSESMPTPCDPTNTSLYTNEHNPFLAYADVADNATRCDTHDVSFVPWEAAVNSTNGSALPNFGFLAPNYLHDAHNTNVSYSDHWLQGWLSPYLNDSWFSSSVFFLTYDESAFSDHSGYNGTDGGNIYFAAVSPYARAGYTDSQNLTFYNLITTTEWLLGLPSLGHGDNWTTFPPLRGLFSFPPPLALTATASVTHAPAPANVSFAASPSGGTPPYNLTWESPNGSVLGYGATLQRTIPVAGNFTVLVRARDSRNVTNATSLTVDAYAPLAARVALSAANVTVGATVTASAMVSGGTDVGLGYRWSWNGSPLASTNQSVRVLAETLGNFPVAVTVTDGWGDSANASALVHVAESGTGGSNHSRHNITPPGPAPPVAVPGFPLWGVAAIAAAAVLGTFLAVRYVRRPLARARAEPAGASPDAPGPPAP
jgi:hypothetical protein